MGRVHFRALLRYFGALLDANCFALQMIDRGMCCEVRLYSGEIVKEWSSHASIMWHSACLINIY